MTDQPPTRQQLNLLLAELMRRPRTAEMAKAVDKVKAQIRACPR